MTAHQIGFHGVIILNKKAKLRNCTKRSEQTISQKDFRLKDALWLGRTYPSTTAVVATSPTHSKNRPIYVLSMWSATHMSAITTAIPIAA